MPNELIFLLELVADFGLCLLVYKWLRREGLMLLIVLHIIMCNLQVVKQVELLGIAATLGNIAYGVTFWCTDLLSEKYGKKQAKRGVLIGFIALIMFSAVMAFVPLYTPGESDWGDRLVSPLFRFVPRLALASVCAYLVSQYHDVWLFHLIRDITGGRYLWLRNNAATMLSQLWDTLIFCTIAFVGVFPWPVLIQISLSTWLLKAIVAALDTPFIYLGTRWRWIAQATEE
ncbi:MAG: hypothetical protein A2Y63_03555 [Candidatus Riflebacteria bacterium RBG_13_59_9]|nr:MAG: hypothetical protein A2Y63_03555 [Candidatus Riflebacteria bacterium RBG_13_59_9]